MHWWPQLAAPHRRRLSLAASLAGLAFLVAALRSEGQRDTALRSLVLVGPATSTAHASATASLYYYVLTGFCLLLGFTGLIASDPLARWLRPRPLLSTAAVAWLVTLVRALLEKSAAPSVLVDAVGVTWLAPRPRGAGGGGRPARAGPPPLRVPGPGRRRGRRRDGHPARRRHALRRVAADRGRGRLLGPYVGVRGGKLD